MKILQVNKYYSPIVGGVETVCKQYSDHLANNHDVTVLCAKKQLSLLSSVEYIEGVKVIRCGSFGTFFSMPVSVTFIFHFMFLALKSEIIFLHLPCPLIDLALFFTRLKNKKIIVVWHSEIIRQQKLRKLLHPLFLNTIKKATIILVTSPNLIKHSKYLDKVKEKCFVLPLSINTEAINNIIEDVSSPALIDKVGDVDALFLGRLSSYKGVEILLDALTLLKGKSVSPRVVIAGAGELASFIESVIYKKQLKNVIFINRFISEQEKYLLLNKTKFFLFPSTEASEAFGITQLEAMFLGTPVINTYLKSGVPWVSQHNVSGLTVAPANAQELAEAIELLYTQSKLTDILGQGAIKRVVDNFDDRLILNKLDNIISQ